MWVFATAAHQPRRFVLEVASSLSWTWAAEIVEADLKAVAHAIWRKGAGLTVGSDTWL